MNNEMITIEANSIEKVQAHALAIEAIKKIDDLETAVKSISVRSEESAKEATDIAKEAREMKKTIEDQRNIHVKPHNLFVKAINNFFRTYTDRIGKSETEIRDKLSKYMAQKREREQKKQQKAAEAGKEIKPIVKSIESENGKTFTKTVTDFEITNIEKLPREYLIPDMSLIRKSVQAGIENIPGVRIYKREQLNIR